MIQRYTRLTVFYAAIAVCSFATSNCSGLGVSNGPWPQFGIDPAGDRQSQYIGPATAPSIKWKFTTGDLVYATPIVDSNSTVYAPSYDGKVYAITGNGSLAWSHVLGGQLRGTGALTDTGNLLLLENNGLYSFNSSGVLNSSNSAIANSDPSVTIAGNGTYYVSDSATTTMFAFNSTGTQQWSLQLGARMEGTPVVGPHGDLYFGTSDGTLRAVTSAGSPEWSFPIPGHNVKSATVDADGTIYAGGQNGDFIAINPNGTEKWRFTQPDDIYTAAALGPNHDVIFAASDGIYSLNTTNGGLNWKYANVSFGHGSVFVDAQGSVYATRNNSVISLSEAGGLRWSFSLAPSEYIYSSITLDKNGVLYVGAQDGVFALAVPEPGPALWLVALVIGVAQCRSRGPVALR